MVTATTYLYKVSSAWFEEARLDLLSNVYCQVVTIDPHSRHQFLSPAVGLPFWVWGAHSASAMPVSVFLPVGCVGVSCRRRFCLLVA